ncbi:MAG TPA: hypothetical protein VMY34_08450, partial [Acidimicrobiales bacterium]|nr:hypothetical protein [Acidimicrobiales bacterium]
MNTTLGFLISARLRRAIAFLLVAIVAVTLPSSAALAATVSQTSGGPYTATTSTTETCTASSPSTTSCGSTATATEAGAFELTASVTKGVLPDGALAASAQATITVPAPVTRPV